MCSVPRQWRERADTPWQKRLLQFHRHAQVGFHLVVPHPDLALFGLELKNVPAQQRVLHFKERLRGNQPDELAGQSTSRTSS